MSENNLTIKNENLLTLAGENGLGTLIKPLTTEIHLFDSYIAGVSWIKDQSVIEKISIDDKLILRREDNKFDKNAIILLNSENQKVGYVPEKDNIIFARLMDAGKMLSATVISKEQKCSYTLIKIGIYLIDF